MTQLRAVKLTLTGQVREELHPQWHADVERLEQEVPLRGAHDLIRQHQQDEDPLQTRSWARNLRWWERGNASASAMIWYETAEGCRGSHGISFNLADNLLHLVIAAAGLAAYFATAPRTASGPVA